MKTFWNIENFEDVISFCRFLFTMNRDKDIAHESFTFKIIFCLQASTWHTKMMRGDDLITVHEKYFF
jgi:hypothetical protein